MYRNDQEEDGEAVVEDRKYSSLVDNSPWNSGLYIFRQISAGSNEGTTGTSAISGGVSSDGSHTSDISNKETPSGQSTSETSGHKPGQSGISSGISDLMPKSDALTGGLRQVFNLMLLTKLLIGSFSQSNDVIG